jgi:hypothetical protein
VSDDERVDIEYMENEIAETYDMITEAWEQRRWLAWGGLSAWQLGARIRLWMMYRGWIK